MTETVPWLATYTRVPVAFTATPVGFVPTGTVATTVLDAVSITETVPSQELATYTRVLLGFSATPNGSWPTVTVAIGRAAVGSTTDSVFDMKFDTYANGAAPATDAVLRTSVNRAMRIPETPLVPENRLGSGHLVFMPSRWCSGDARRESRICFGAYTRTWPRAWVRSA